MIPELAPAARRHLADQLGVPPDAPPADVRAAFLRRLPSAGFLPAPPLCAAATALTARPVPGTKDAVAENDDDEVRAAVTAFAREFWALPPHRRREQWRELLDRAAGDPLLAGRVRRLEAGVDLPNAADGAATPRQRQLIGMVQGLFVLGPIERAARRRELIDGLPPPTRAWETAALEIARDFPAHAALEPALVERLSTWSRRPKPDARAVGRPAATWGFQTQGGLNVPQVRRPVRAAGGRRATVWPWILLVSILVGRLGSLATSDSPSTSRPAPYSAPPHTQPYQVPAPVFLPKDAETIGRSRNEKAPANSTLEEALRKALERESRQSPPERGPP
jgi:hypothetical protein